MILTDKQKEYIIGYASALQHIMYKLTGENTCGKSYDPCMFEGNMMHSYAFDMKDGGRHHDMGEYKEIEEIEDCMLKEAVEWIKER
jgi:hypothetical protein